VKEDGDYPILMLCSLCSSMIIDGLSDHRLPLTIAMSLRETSLPGPVVASG
jgi:hypothetical protein